MRLVASYVVAKHLTKTIYINHFERTITYAQSLPQLTCM